MQFWQHAATFLAFALIAALIVFAGHQHHTSFAAGGDARVDAQVAATEK